MDLGHLINGGAIAVLDIILLAFIFTSRRVWLISLRVCFAYFCIIDLVFNTLHVAQGLGYEWATAELRHRVLAWVIIPHIVFGIFACVILARMRNQSSGKDIA
jgi:hypothetical protein